MPAVNEAIQSGIDIDQMTGVNVNHNAFAQDHRASSTMMESMMQNMQNGMIGGHHWSELQSSVPLEISIKLLVLLLKHMSTQVME